MAQLLDQLEYLSGILRHMVARVILHDNLNAVLASGADRPLRLRGRYLSPSTGQAAVLLVPSTDWMRVMAKPFAMAALATRVRELIVL
jgi:hypothetical protein